MNAPLLAADLKDRFARLRDTEAALKQLHRELNMEHVKPLTEDHLAVESYNPAMLLDALIVRLNLKNDAALAATLQQPASVISKLRNRITSLSHGIQVRMSDVTGLLPREIRKLAGL